MTQSQAAGRVRRASTPRASLSRDPHLSLYLLIAACVAADLSFVPLLPGLRASRGLSGTEAAVLLSGGNVAMIIAPVPLGHLTDRLGARQLLTSAGALVTIASVMLATADGFAALLVGRVLIGLTNA
ncbi:MAG: MFS transporter, partial [Solirubrobacteraceae bacterium]